MGTDYCACGAFGILLSTEKIKAMLGSAYGHLTKMDEQAGEEYSEDLDMPEGGDEYDTRQHYLEWRVNNIALRQIIEQFEKQGIKVPVGAKLWWTGDSDDRPGRVSTSGEDWVLGFGLFTDPWKYPEIHPSFRELSSFHEWVIAG